MTFRKVENRANLVVADVGACVDGVPLNKWAAAKRGYEGDVEVWDGSPPPRVISETRQIESKVC